MNILKNVSLVVVGAAIGIGATYKYFHDKFEGYANEEIESVKQKVRTRDKEALNSVYGQAVCGVDTDTDADKDEKKTPYTQHVKSMYDKGTTPGKAVDEVKEENQMSDKELLNNRTRKDIPFKKTVRTAYDKVVRQYNPEANEQRPLKEDNEEEKVDFTKEEDYSSAEVDEVKASKPYVISADQFVENDNDFQQITITYFAKDDVLVDEDREVIDDIDAVIGDDSIGKFGTMGSPDNLVYVRNEKMNIDYEVIREDLSYEFDEKGLRD